MKKLYVAFLWHMHQPPYRDPDTTELLLPWVRLHGVKDYYDMGRLLDRNPAMHCTVNFVPGLVDQIAEVASGRAVDRYAVASRKPASELTRAERRFIATEFFAVHRASNILPYARYRELLSLREVAPASVDPADWFEDRELRDLQVWFDLAWSGDALRNDPDIAALLRKGRDFTERDKELLARRHQELLGRILPLYGDLGAQGRVELTTSGYYHPILPLLVRTEAGAEADPDTPLPTERFHRPDDAARHIASALTAHERTFGHKPDGMWPPEGSVSSEVLHMLAAHGVRWAATDEVILRKSIAPAVFTADHLCRPWRHGGVNLFFRDHGMSDRIGFVYSSWNIERAVADIIARLDELRRATTLPHPVVTVALDGENAWEYYNSGGMRFLEALYEGLTNAPFLETVTFSEYLDRYGDEVAELPTVKPGSWIDGNFRTWMGDPAKNRAWDLLARMRRAVDPALRGESGLDAAQIEELTDTVMRAEASDWFWWLGEGHSSLHDWEFEQLQLRYIKRAYALAGLTPPADLDRGIDEVRPSAQQARPSQLISPRITGRLESFYEWHGAGRHELQQGSIHRQESGMRLLHYGFDGQSLLLRVDFDDDAHRRLGLGRPVLEIVFDEPTRRVIRLEPGNAPTRPRPTDGAGGELLGVEAASDRFVEIRIPLALLSPDRSTPRKASYDLYARLVDAAGGEAERLPLASNLRIDFDLMEFDLNNWFV